MQKFLNYTGETIIFQTLELISNNKLGLLFKRKDRKVRLQHNIPEYCESIKIVFLPQFKSILELYMPERVDFLYVDQIDVLA